MHWLYSGTRKGLELLALPSVRAGRDGAGDGGCNGSGPVRCGKCTLACHSPQTRAPTVTAGDWTVKVTLTSCIVSSKVAIVHSFVRSQPVTRRRSLYTLPKSRRVHRLRRGRDVHAARRTQNLSSCQAMRRTSGFRSSGRARVEKQSAVDRSLEATRRMNRNREGWSKG